MIETYHYEQCFIDVKHNLRRLSPLPMSVLRKTRLRCRESSHRFTEPSPPRGPLPRSGGFAAAKRGFRSQNGGFGRRPHARHSRGHGCVIQSPKYLLINSLGELPNTSSGATFRSGVNGADATVSLFRSWQARQRGKKVNIEEVGRPSSETIKSFEGMLKKATTDEARQFYREGLEAARAGKWRVNSSVDDAAFWAAVRNSLLTSRGRKLAAENAASPNSPTSLIWSVPSRLPH